MKRKDKPLGERLYDELCRDIIQGRIAPGINLLAERKLAESRGLNRGAVREAMKRLAQMRRALPPGVRIDRIYDRSALVDVTTHTVLHNMVMGVVLIFLIQWLFLGDLRSALIVSATIPFALLFAVVVLVLSGESANLLSMGAIDFGIIVDATVIMVENIFRHLAEASAGHAPQPSSLTTPRRLTGKLATIYQASGEVTQAIFFSATIIIAGFLPLFTLSGVEGHIFGPMARTYAYALIGAVIATFTVTPALSAIITVEITLPQTKIELPSEGARTRAATISSAMRAAPHTNTMTLSMWPPRGATRVSREPYTATASTG